MSGLELELQGVGILDEATANARAMGDVAGGVLKDGNQK